MPLVGLEILLGIAIGLSLGLLGGGGSILTVPALVYLVGLEPQVAVSTSLAIVGANSLIGAFFRRKDGSLNGRVALLFGGTGMLAAYLAAGLSKHLPESLLLSIFAGLMLLVGAMMITRRNADHPSATGGRRFWVVLASGLGVGTLTGLLGVGGGFLIVPALVMLVGLPMGQAVGTSLVIIAANSLAGFLGHLGQGHIDLPVTITFIIAGFAGALAGTRLCQRLPANRVRQAFGGFVILLSVFLFVDNLPGLFS
jgi:hypothetical protein